MDHSVTITQFLLAISLFINGFWLGKRLVLWCRHQRKRLLMATLSLLCLEAVLFYFYVFASLPAQIHVFVVAITDLNDAILITCFGEGVRIAPHPWGRGETRTV